MIRFHQKITIINVKKPETKNINRDLQWFGTSLGLFNLRDKDKSCFRLFIELLKTTKIRVPLSSDELALKLSLSRGTVVHHLNKLMESGIVINYRNRYMLRVDNLKSLIDEVEKDMIGTFKRLRRTAEEIDNSLGL